MHYPKSESGHCTSSAPLSVLTLGMLCQILVVELERQWEGLFAREITQRGEKSWFGEAEGGALLCLLSLSFKLWGVTPILRVQRVNRKRDFHGNVRSTCDSPGLNFKGQVKRERGSWMLALYMGEIVHSCEMLTSVILPRWLGPRVRGCLSAGSKS